VRRSASRHTGRARALRALGDEDGATDLFERLLQSARQRAAQPQTIDYFATSLPTFLVFEDDLDHRNQRRMPLSRGSGPVRARTVRHCHHLLSEVLELDISHSGARWHLQAIAADLGSDRLDLRVDGSCLRRLS